MKYFWQHKEFPNFQFNSEEFKNYFQEFALLLGEVNGLLVNVSDKNKNKVLLQIMVAEALKTSEIEGEYFSREDVMSSLQKQLGIQEYVMPSKNKKAQAIAELMLQVRKDYLKPFSLSMIIQWHQILMKYDKTINEGQWRKSTEPMQIISGRPGKIEVHFEAPAAKDLPNLLVDFEKWYQNFQYKENGLIGNAMLHAALAHLYFETLHPFEDGNGRIGRAIAEKALAEIVEQPVFLSLSKNIEENKKEYYKTLKETQQKQEVTNWLHFFFKMIIEAQKEVKEKVLFVIKKVKLFDQYKNQLNQRQIKVIQKMTEAGNPTYEGGMTAKKYIAITKTSKATATRDLQQLNEIELILKEGEGRNVKYQINWKKL